MIEAFKIRYQWPRPWLGAQGVKRGHLDRIPPIHDACKAASIRGHGAVRFGGGQDELGILHLCLSGAGITPRVARAPFRNTSLARDLHGYEYSTSNVTRSSVQGTGSPSFNDVHSRRVDEAVNLVSLSKFDRASASRCNRSAHSKSDGGA